MLLKNFQQRLQQGGRIHLQQVCGQLTLGGGEVPAVEGMAALHMVLSKLEVQTNLNLMKFNTDRCKLSAWDRAGP